MKKIINKIKKILEIVGAFLFALSKKVQASAPPLYGLAPSEPRELTSNNMAPLLNILRLFIIPIVLVIGLIVYLVKSKSSKQKKIVISICTLLAGMIAYFFVKNKF